jgi:hypothetical protein
MSVDPAFSDPRRNVCKDGQLENCSILLLQFVA